MILALAAEKGGVGKTTLAVNPMTLRQELAEQTGAEPLAIKPATPEEGLKQVVEALNASAEKRGAKGTWKAKAAEPMPWDNAHPKVKIHFGLRLPEKLHKQFEYAANHTMGDSMQSFALRALDEAVHRRLKELGVI